MNLPPAFARYPSGVTARDVLCGRERRRRRQPTAPPITVKHRRGLLDALVDLPDGFMLAVESTGRWDPEMLQKLLHAELATRRPGLLGARRVRTHLVGGRGFWVWCEPVDQEPPRCGKDSPVVRAAAGADGRAGRGKGPRPGRRGSTAPSCC